MCWWRRGESAGSNFDGDGREKRADNEQFEQYTDSMRHHRRQHGRWRRRGQGRHDFAKGRKPMGERRIEKLSNFILLKQIHLGTFDSETDMQIVRNKEKVSKRRTEQLKNGVKVRKSEKFAKLFEKKS